MKAIFLVLFLAAFAEAASAQRYVFYLHGKIVEDQGPNARNEAFGTYEYENILAAFREEHFTVISECRKPDTDVKEYAHKVAAQADSLLKLGVKPGNITVIGASKGALIAMYVSTYLKNPHVNFVFMSSCNDYVMGSLTDIAFCGNILSIHEKSDEGNGACDKLKDLSKMPVPHYKDLEINTGLKHGYLYKPISEWMNPAIGWAKEVYN
jgi:hypothetical protein